MVISVPLINPVYAVVYRLDIQATWGTDPPGDMDTGYDDILREPVVYRSSGERNVVREEMSPVTIPCQVEISTFEELRTVFGGNDAVTDMTFVFHRKDLRNLSLLDATTDKCVLKPGDRIDRIEKPQGTQVQAFSKPLYIYELRPGSWGFGTSGYDLEIAYTTYRSQAPYGG